ncbi:MAG: Uma2 family endonuclease [Anaerolineae bacterium]|nr:Uma2 family endonuclease [Anaerolineae bacterium]
MTKPRDPPPRPAPRRAPTAAPAAPDDSRFIVHPLPSAYPKHGPPTPEDLAELAAWEREGGIGVLPRLLWPKIDHIITEDDEPVDNIFSEKQQRLLTESLYTSWAGPGEGRPFLAAANVGLFFSPNQPPLVPDVMLAVDVRTHAYDLWANEHRSYFIWEYGKTPEIVIEVVSNREGAENTRKRARYAQWGVSYYVIFDPFNQLGEGVLHVLQLQGHTYVELPSHWFAEAHIGLTLWQGDYEGVNTTWLRWCDGEGNLIPTGAERARAEHQRAEAERQRSETARQRAEAERQRAEAERQRAEAERQRAETAEQQAALARDRSERLLAQLRALGIEPTNGD